MKKENIVAERPGKQIFRDGDKLVKLFDRGYSKADILNEALNQARVEETDLNIPKIQAVSTVDGKWSITMDYIEGTTLEQLMELNPGKTDEYLDLFVDVQMNIHSKRVPMLNFLTEKMNRKISAAELDATTRYDLHTRLNGMKRHFKLCQRRLQPQQRNNHQGRHAVRYRLGACHPGQRRRGRGAHLPAVLSAGQERARRQVSEAVLQEVRHSHSVCPEVDTDSCGFPPC